MQTPAPVDYARATSIDEALQLLREKGEDARLIAGGHSLLPMMRLRLAQPEWVIDINDLHDLDYLRVEGEELVIGALTRHATLLDFARVGGHETIFSDVEALIADPIVRQHGTVGGSFCQADPAEDLSAVGCRAQGDPGDPLGVRHPHRARPGVPPGSLRDGGRPGRDRSPRSGCPCGPAPAAPTRRSSGGPATGRSPASAPTSCCVDGTVADVGIGLTALGAEHFCAPGAEESLVGKAPTDENIAEAGRLAAEACNPQPDQRGPVDYKRHLAAELTVRALRRSVERALGEGRDMQVTMTVNGAEVTAEIEPRLLLVHFVRDHLGLTGTHWGCDTSNCGTCVLWVDDKPVKSCTMLAAMADGRRVRTVEDLAAGPDLDPVQQGFMPSTACSAGSAPRA